MRAPVTMPLVAAYSETRTCPRCRLPQPAAAFRYGQSYCRTCHAESERSRRGKPPADHRFSVWRVKPYGSTDALRIHANRISNPSLARTYQRDVDLRRSYGITLSQYEEMASAQGGVCAICERPQSSGRNLHVDHCHATGRVRGLLCSACNVGLGNLGDTADALRRALVYVEGSA